MKNSQGESVSDAEPDEALKEFEALMTANDIIIRSAFYYILLPSLFAAYRTKCVSDSEVSTQVDASFSFV